TLLESFEFFSQGVHTTPRCSRQRYAACMRVTERLHDVQPCGYADVRVPALLVAKGFRLLKLLLDQVRQFQVFEHEVEKLLAGNLEGEIVQTLAGIAGLAASATLPPHRPLDPIAGDEFPVAGQDAALATAASVPEDRFRDIFPWDTDLISAICIGDASLVDGISDSFLDVLAKAAKEALPVDGTLVATLHPPVDDQECHQRFIP